MLSSMNAFIDYFGSIRRRTLNYIRALPPDQIGWSPKPGEYTCADILRHFAAAEQMYVALVKERRWRYPGHGQAAETTLEALVMHLESVHTGSMAALKALGDEVLMQPRPSFLAGSPPVKVWRWLMAMAEHEIHHRSQLASYLMLMGRDAPQIYGVSVEELIAGASE
jgi:uncharacterized damage-inducible protein DinB